MSAAWLAQPFPAMANHIRLGTLNPQWVRLNREKTVPGRMINLLPPQPQPRKANDPNGASPSGASGTPLPRFGTPTKFVTDGFWGNLKQFLTERPVKLHGDAHSPLMPENYGDGFKENLKTVFKSGPVPKGPSNSRLEVAWGAGFGGFGDRIKELFFPVKQAPAQWTSKPVKVKDIWSKDENFGWTQVISIGLHVGIIALLVIPLFTHILPSSTQAKNKFDSTPLDISPYIAKLPAGNKKAGGGGGGGDRSITPPTKGRAPKFAYTQFTPPEATIKNLAPKLPMDPTLLGPPELRIANPPLPNMGDPMAGAVTMSGGPGGGGGIGVGTSGGIGSGTGAGLGPGETAGTGGGAFRAGVNGVGSPQCIYCPDPEYSDEARKAKYQGTVLLDVTVTTDGRIVNPVVIKGPGLGMEEKALAKVRTWKLRPALGPGGKPVNCRIQIEVTFHLY
jgi:periplasmic protein TonB